MKHFVIVIILYICFAQIVLSRMKDEDCRKEGKSCDFRLGMQGKATHICCKPLKCLRKGTRSAEDPDLRFSADDGYCKAEDKKLNSEACDEGSECASGFCGQRYCTDNFKICRIKGECSAPPKPKPQCKISGSCKDNSVCCPDFTCENKVCTGGKNTVPTECKEDSDCGTSAYCQDGQCQTD